MCLGGPCGCISVSSAAVLLKLRTGRSLRLTLAKVFAGSKVGFLSSHKLGLLLIKSQLSPFSPDAPAVCVAG